MNYYNDNDPKAAAWLRELIREGCLPAGVVDERSIDDITPRIATQQHFFAGIGGWSYALQLAGWPADRPVWTGSCPCQPFSIAGKKLGVEDPRHLWPAFLNLIRFCWPPVIFGEQVASKAGKVWLAGVRTDLEALGYRVGAADLCAAGIGSPHIRQRLFWVADRDGGRRGQTRSSESLCQEQDPEHGSGPGWVADAERHGGWSNKPRWGQEGRATDGRSGGLGDTDCAGRGEQSGSIPIPAQQPTSQLRGDLSGLDDTTSSRCHRALGHTEGEARHETRLCVPHTGRQGSRLGDSESGGCGVERDEALEREGRYLISPDWSRFELIWCRDNKTRRIESGTFPLVAGLPRGVVPSGDPSYAEAQASPEARVARLKGYGNSIVPQLAAEFIKAYLDL